MPLASSPRASCAWAALSRSSCLSHVSGKRWRSSRVAEIGFSACIVADPFEPVSSSIRRTRLHDPLSPKWNKAFSGQCVAGN